MDNPVFVDEENIPLVNQDGKEYCDDYRTPDTSRIENHLHYLILQKEHQPYD